MLSAGVFAYAVLSEREHYGARHEVARDFVITTEAAYVFLLFWWWIARVLTHYHDTPNRIYYLSGSWALLFLVAWLIHLGWQGVRGNVGLRDPPTTFAGVVSGAGRNVVLITLLFAGMSAVLRLAGAVQSGLHAKGSSNAWSPIRYYAWNFLDQVPVLQISKSFAWYVHPLYVGVIGGLLLVLYKVVVIVPTFLAVGQGWKLHESRRLVGRPDQIEISRT